MPFQNRVTPFGNIIADKARGMFTGNRGILHDPVTKNLHPTRRWTSKAWIYCSCDFKGRRRDVFGRNGPDGSPGWTNLFFLDEATALAAGHRPCFYCQRSRANEFQTAFSKGQKSEKMRAMQIDKVLHNERLDGRQKRTHILPEYLPDGVMVTNGNDAYLVYKNALKKWSPAGYNQKIMIRDDLFLLTPPSTFKAILNGYSPILHQSAYTR